MHELLDTGMLRLKYPMKLLNGPSKFSFKIFYVIPSQMIQRGAESDFQFILIIFMGNLNLY